MSPFRRSWCAVVVVMAGLLGSGCITLNPASQPLSTGEPLRVETYGNRAVFRQGRQVLDEQDFYDLAGDRAAVAAVQNRRRELVALQYAWQGMGLASIAGTALAGGALAGSIYMVREDIFLGELALVGSALALTGGIVAIPLSYVFAADYADEMYEQVLPTARAERAAGGGGSADGNRNKKRSKKSGRSRRSSR